VLGVDDLRRGVSLLTVAQRPKTDGVEGAATVSKETNVQTSCGTNLAVPMMSFALIPLAVRGRVPHWDKQVIVPPTGPVHRRRTRFRRHRANEDVGASEVGRTAW
jgi:hypothetical protein